MNAASKLITAMHTAAGTRGRYVSGWITLAQTDDSLRAAVRAVFGKRMPTPQKLGQWLSENVGPHSELILEGKHSARKKAWAYRVATPAEVAESQRKREASDAVSRQEAQRREFERQAVRDARLERAKGKGRPTATITQAAPTPPPGFFQGINRIEREPVSSGTMAPEPTPEPTQPVSKRDHFPTWLREGRQPTRQEWDAHQSARMPYRAVCNPTAFRNSGSELVPVESFVSYRNGVDFNARPDGTRVPVYNDSPDAWRHGGPNWTKKL